MDELKRKLEEEVNETIKALFNVPNYEKFDQIKIEILKELLQVVFEKYNENALPIIETYLSEQLRKQREEIAEKEGIHCEFCQDEGWIPKTSFLTANQFDSSCECHQHKGSKYRIKNFAPEKEG